MFFKVNMFGEMNPLCFLIGHKWVLYGSDRRALCLRCEVHNKKFYVNEKEGVEC